MSALTLAAVLLAAAPWLLVSAFMIWCLRGAGEFREEPVFWSAIVALWPLWLIVIGAAALLDRGKET